MNARRPLLAVGLVLLVFAGGVFAGRRKPTPGPYRMILLNNAFVSKTRDPGTDYIQSPHATNALNQLFKEGYEAISISGVGAGTIAVLLKAR